MKKKILILCVLSVLFTAILSGNGQSEKKADYDLQAMSWDEIMAQAKLEGSLTWFQWYLQPAFREFVVTFQQEYGIEVVITDGSLDANKNKLLAEKNRPIGDIDLISLGGDTLATIDPAEFLYGPLVSTIPGGEKLRTRVMGSDSRGYAFVFWGNQTGIAYDPQKINAADLPQTMEELGLWMKSNPKDLGFNITNGGSGPSFIRSIVKNTVSGVDFSDGTITPEKREKLAPAWKWFSDLEGTYIITASNADSLTRLSDGEFTLVPAWEDHLAGLQKKNEIDKRIKYYIPEFGMPGGGNVIGIPANAPNKAAALVFLTWITSAEIQSQLNEVFGSSPQHPDASGEFALVPTSQRINSTDMVPKPFQDDIITTFEENVSLK